MELYYRFPVFILGISLLLCLISYLEDGEFSKFWSVASNVAYVAPVLIAYYNRQKTWLFVYFFSLVIVFSTGYHLCYAYEDNACLVINYDNWGHTDVLFSWLLLYTLICYVVFKNEYTDITLLTNVVIVVVTLEAGCRAANFDCQSSKIILAFVYVLILLYRMITEEYYKLLHLRDAAFALISIGVATIFYFNGPENFPSHSLWHVLGAVGGCLALTIYKDSKLHTLGFEIKKTNKVKEEAQPLLARKELF